MNELCELLSWDSEFFGFPIARLKAQRLDGKLLRQLEHWLGLHRPQCVYFLADLDDQETHRLAPAAGFRLVDVRITLERPSPSARADFPRVRTASPEDVHGLRRIAASSHRDTRFYFDGRFPPDRCDELYSVWIEKSVAGYAQIVLTSGPPGAPLGYVTCHMDTSGVGVIGLMGVAEVARGQGLGLELVSAACQWMSGHGARELKVVTQGRNIAAQRLYQRAGFSTGSVEIWYHAWPAAERQ